MARTTGGYVEMGEMVVHVLTAGFVNAKQAGHAVESLSDQINATKDNVGEVLYSLMLQPSPSGACFLAMEMDVRDVLSCMEDNCKFLEV